MRLISFILIYLLVSKLSYANQEQNISSWTIDSKINSNSIESYDLKYSTVKYHPKIALIDTGIDFNNPFLAENITLSTPGVSPDKNHFGIDFSNGTKTTTRPQDEHGHGTHLAGIMKSVFPDIKILPLKYYSQKDHDGNNLRATINSIRYAIDCSVDIINYSGGGVLPSEEEKKLLTEASNKGIIIVVAAGNNGANIDQGKQHYYPANYKLPSMITVTAHNQYGKLMPMANWGNSTVHISAPGEKISSILPHQKWGEMSGTSQATAFTTAVVALIKSQFPSLNAREIKEIILQTADKRAQFNGKCLSGGLLKASKAYKLAKDYSDHQKIVAQSGHDSQKL